MLHVLPKGFHRIRHYGLLASAGRKANVARARQLLGELDFFKVAHHGSENATPVDVVNALKKSGLAAMVPTQVKPFPTIPRIGETGVDARARGGDEIVLTLQRLEDKYGPRFVPDAGWDRFTTRK